MVKSTWVWVLLAAVGVLLAVLADNAISPRTARLVISRDVEIIMICRSDVCYPEGHTYRGQFEAWVQD